MTVAVKTCGLSTPESVACAVDGGAAFVGFVFYPPSPRAVTIDTAAALAAEVPEAVKQVGLFVDAATSYRWTCCSCTALNPPTGLPISAAGSGKPS